MTTITFIGAGSTVFTRNLAGDILSRPALAEATIRLMDIDPGRLDDSRVIVSKMAETLAKQHGTGGAAIETYDDQRAALDGADFVIVCFQIGGYRPSTVIDFDIPKQFGLEQTIADTLGIGGIMRGLRTVPHLWRICEDMEELCPEAHLLQYVNPMAINTWAIAARHPKIQQVGLCHSVQGTIAELARDLDLPVDDIRYEAAGINHMSFYTRLEQRLPDGRFADLYPALRAGYRDGHLPKPPKHNPRCPNFVRYEMMERLGYFVTESSEHFAEYVPWFIKAGREDLIEKFGIPLDEYPKRCEAQMADWAAEADALRDAAEIAVEPSHEYASDIVNAVVTGQPAMIYGNVANTGLIPQLPEGCAVEIPVLVDANGLHPTQAHDLPPQLTALMRTNINVQELTVQALLDENREHLFHAAMLDPHTGTQLDLDQIWAMTAALLEAHGDMIPNWARG